jgi:hypothetical protein
MEIRRPLTRLRRKAAANHLHREKSKLRYAAVDDQFRSRHERRIVTREEQGCLSDFAGLAETMKRDVLPSAREFP